jgi:EAL domain-containing protein (putative c-di-GMP-specific phosphodiesterase class I)
MADEKNLKSQRDRFLAFAFASADLFIEISEDQKIIYALGAAKGIIGIADTSLIGKDWLELFSPIDRPVLRTLLGKARPVLRCGPVLVTMNKEISDGKKAVVTGIKMPDSPKFYITVGHSNMMMAKIGETIRKENEAAILNKDDFMDAAIEALNVAQSLGQDVDITLFDVGATPEDVHRLGPEAWKAFTDSISELLLSKSANGQMAAEITDGRYSLIHDKNVDPEALLSQIKELAQEQDPNGTGFDITTKTVTSDLSELSERDASRALMYTIHEFERKGTELTIETLNSGLKSYVNANAARIREFQSIIERTHFNLYFQPIVDLKTLQASHYEMLCRFEKGDTLEWIMFGEDIGMASEFDLAVCERAINYARFKAGGTKTRFSVNLSGQSIQCEEFNEKLIDMLSKDDKLKNRLIFEVTESSHIKDLDMVNEFIKKLKNQGYQVALDDFGAGSASFQYLQQLEVDHLKIDGKYTRKILNSERDVAMIKNLTNMCRDMGIKVVAEFVENLEQWKLLRELGVNYGQGYLFGKPSPKPDYIPNEDLKAHIV